MKIRMNIFKLHCTHIYVPGYCNLLDKEYLKVNNNYYNVKERAPALMDNLL